MFLGRSKYRFLLLLVLSFCLLLFSSGASLAAPSDVGSFDVTSFSSSRDGDFVNVQCNFPNNIALVESKYLAIGKITFQVNRTNWKGSLDILSSDGWVRIYTLKNVSSGTGSVVLETVIFVDNPRLLTFRINTEEGMINSISLSGQSNSKIMNFVPAPSSGISEGEMQTFISNVNNSLTTINNNINNVSNAVSSLPADFGDALEHSNEQVYGSDDAELDSALDDLLADMQEHLGFVGDLVVMPISILNQLMTGSASATVSAGTLNLLGASAPISFDFTFLDSLQPYFYTMTTAVCGFVLWQTLKDAYSYLFGVDV